jgi:hypothetical protein
VSIVPEPVLSAAGGALPNIVVIGAMKCGTTALHDFLDRHPEIAMSRAKELNFFFGPDVAPAGARPYGEPLAWAAGNWHRGLRWYAAQFDAAAPMRGESSPGYTSPARPEVAARIAAHLPDAKLIYLVRDPVERALSQYRHHVAEGTERRAPVEALFDPHSQYLARSRYHERLAPFAARFCRTRIHVVALEDLLAARRRTLTSLFAFLGVDGRYPWRTLPPPPAAAAPAEGTDGLRRRLAEAVRDDADRLRKFTGTAYRGWSV